MKKAFVIALAIHLCFLVGAGYIYILPPEKRAKFFEVIRPEQKPKKEVKIAPAKVKKPTPRPLKRRVESMDLLGVAGGETAPEFTVGMAMAKPVQAVYTPGIAASLVGLEFSGGEAAEDSCWGRFKEIKVKEKSMELESFGLQGMEVTPPTGTQGNMFVVKYTWLNSGTAFMRDKDGLKMGIFYPENRELAVISQQSNLPPWEVTLGPYDCRLEDIILYIEDYAGVMPSNGEYWRAPEKEGPYTMKYTCHGEARDDNDDCTFTVTAMPPSGGGF